MSDDAYKDALFRLYGSMLDRASEVLPPPEHTHGLWQKITDSCRACDEGYYRSAGRQQAFDTAAFMVRAAITAATTALRAFVPPSGGGGAGDAPHA